MRRIRISSELCTRLLAAVRAVYPREGCGALLGYEDGNGCLEITAIEALPNAEAVRGKDRFAIDPLSYAGLERRLSTAPTGSRCRVLGFFHSHPDGVARPSSVDLECAAGLFEVARNHYVYAIAALGEDGTAELSFWDLDATAKAFIAVPTV